MSRPIVVIVCMTWLLRIVGALTAPTSMALTCRWRSRPQHQKQTSTVATATSVRWHRAAGAPGLISRTLAEMLAARLRRKSGDGLAMSVAEYASYDAVGLAELVRKREVSPTELVEA